jgi:hypothetical protein
MDYTAIAQWNALFNILLVILIIAVLVGFSASFQNVVNVMVVFPLDKLMTTLRTSATVMLKSMHAIGKEDAKEENDEDNIDTELETVALEKMVDRCQYS